MKTAVILSPAQDWEKVRNRLPVEISWLVAESEESEIGDLPVYPSVSEGMAAEAVDLVVDGSEQLTAEQCPGAALISWRAAGLLLDAVASEAAAKPVVVEDSAGIISSAAKRINEDVGKIMRQLETMEGHCRHLVDTGAQLDTVSRNILDSLDRTTSILDSITRIAKRSKIIGLNSAIEASRVGETGRGFLVVAEEIKTLADDSSRSVREIERILSGIQRRSEEFSQRIGTIRDVSDLQQQATDQISALIQGLRELGRHLKELAAEVA